MKRFLLWLLMATLLLSFGGCASEEAPPATTAAPETAPAVETAVPETEPAAPETTEAKIEDPMFLKVSAITFSLVGESEDIYLGLVPRELVTWESEDPSIVSVENGVLTAVGVGSTTIRAVYNDRELTCTAGCLAETQVEWYDGAAACVILASGGYPVSYKSGYPIAGLEEAGKTATVFHAGTKKDGEAILTAGGRVLGVTATAQNLACAIDKAYEAARKITFTDMHMRSDIGQRALKEAKA